MKKAKAMFEQMRKMEFRVKPIKAKGVWGGKKGERQKKPNS